MRGNLKIFFGYCAGTGKTYAMLKAAHEKQKEGIDIIIGYIERHDRKDTIALIDGLEEIPPLEINYHGVLLHEFDLDKTLARKPKIVLVDELAHTNASSMRHPKRYSDIQELLHAGIDVYTTVNVQHLESLQDIVASITRIQVNERIPDKVFDHADQVELVDIEPDDLIERLKEGKIYKKSQTKSALENFFAIDNLIALREIALRRCADRVNKKINVNTRSFTKEHILVCLSASPSNAKVIRTAARMASAFFAEFTALYVETANTNPSKEDLVILEKNRELAKHFHANIIHVFGENVADQISEYARISSVSKVVLGRSQNRKTFLSHNNLVDELIQRSPDLDIYIIPERLREGGQNPARQKMKVSFDLRVGEALASLAVFVTATLIGLWLYQSGYTESNIIMIYLLAVVLISYITSSRFYGVFISVFIVASFNFLFTVPRFSFQAYDPSHAMTFAILLIVSIITSTLTRKTKRQASINAMQAHRTEILLETSQKLQQSENMIELAQVSCEQLYQLLNKTIIIYSVHHGELQPPLIFPQMSDEEEEVYLNPKEKTVAQWVLTNNKMAGVSTNTLSASKGMYLSIRKKDQVFAVIGIAMNPKESLSPFEKSLFTTILNEIALAMASMHKQKRQKEGKRQIGNGI